MKKQLVFDDIVLEGFEITYSDKISYGKDKTNIAAEIELTALMLGVDEVIWGEVDESCAA